MAVKQRDKTREELIQNIKDCGQSLIDNMEVCKSKTFYSSRGDLINEKTESKK